MSTETLLVCVRAARDAIMAAEDRIEGLDRAIGDGDHYLNVRRGAESAVALCEAQVDDPADVVLKALGLKLLSTIGGASGPLMASFFLAAAKTPGVAGEWNTTTVAAMVHDGVAAIKARGKADVGAKTMLDTLVPVAEALQRGAAAGDAPSELRQRICEAAEAGMQSTADMLAKFGRAAFLGERARGHIDPGAMSCFVIAAAICEATQPVSA